MTNREVLVAAAAGAAHDARCGFHRAGTVLLGHHGVEEVAQRDVEAALPVIVAAVTDEVRAWLAVGGAMRAGLGLSDDYRAGGDDEVAALLVALEALDNQMGVTR